MIAPLLTAVFNKCLELQYCPPTFKDSITVVLRKPGKSDYAEPKSYRPVALMNTLGKILDAVMARRMQYAAERYGLLPAMHTGGRAASSTEHALHIILEKIHAGWRNEQVASLLMLDLSGAFDNISLPRLLHNLRRRRIPP